MQYNDQFRQYQGDMYEYEEVIRKINDMENKRRQEMGIT